MKVVEVIREIDSANHYIQLFFNSEDSRSLELDQDDLDDLVHLLTAYTNLLRKLEVQV